MKSLDTRSLANSASHAAQKADVSGDTGVIVVASNNALRVACITLSERSHPNITMT
jgi:hypothetical protein